MPQLSKRRAHSPDDEPAATATRPRKSAKTSSAQVKRSTATTSEPAVKGGTDSNGDAYWELSGKRRVTVSQFKGKSMVSVREYYEKDGATLPGKKGISMTMDQYNTFVGLLPAIEKSLVKKGDKVIRPNYKDGVVADDDVSDEDNEDEKEEEAVKDEDDEDEEELPRKSKKKDSGKRKNIEATSDEEEYDGE